MKPAVVRKRAESLIAAGRINEAAELLRNVWQDLDAELPAYLHDLALRISDRSTTAAYIAAYSLGETDPKAEQLYDFASTSDDRTVAAASLVSLTGLKLARGDELDALPHLLKAVEMGYPPARHLLAHAHFRGKMGLKKDVDEAVRMLRQLVDEGDIDSNVLLAKIMIEERYPAPDIDALQLLTEAAAAGSEEAMMIVLAMGAEAWHDPDHEEEVMLPYVVVPDGMKRPKLVRDAIHLEFDVPRLFAEEFTANLYGYPEWSHLMRAATDPKVKKGVFDESLEPATLNERHRLLAAVVRTHFDMEDYIADIVVDLLKPTAKEGRPSLKKLDDRVNNCMVPVSSKTIDRGMQRLSDGLGITGDFEKSMRTAKPIRPDVWLDMMEAHLGWAFESADAEATADGAWIANSRAKDGTLFDVFMSRVSLTPGDRGDEHVFNLKKEIEKRSSNAVLIFSKPLVHFPNPKENKGALFGGLLLDRGIWHEFVLHPSGGIDDAREQKLVIGEQMDPEMVRPFFFEGAGTLGISLACYLNDLDPEDGDYIPFGTINGWTNFLPREMAMMMKNMVGR